MFDAESVPKNLPQLGFYYHNKRVPESDVRYHAYELVGVGYHTETGEFTVHYRPLYEDAWAFQNGKLIYARPLEMFMDTVEKDGVQVPRFSQITDQQTIEFLEKAREEMYEATSD